MRKTHVAVFRPGAEAQMHIRHRPTGSVGADDNQSADGCARDGSKNTHRDADSISESDFCITAAQNEENDVFC